MVLLIKRVHGHAKPLLWTRMPYAMPRNRNPARMGRVWGNAAFNALPGSLFTFSNLLRKLHGDGSGAFFHPEHHQRLHRADDGIGGQVVDDKVPVGLGVLRNNLQKEMGIPTDSINGGMSEFQCWVDAARNSSFGDKMKVAIKADAATPYKVVKKMMSELQDMSENRYYLITTLAKED